MRCEECEESTTLQTNCNEIRTNYVLIFARKTTVMTNPTFAGISTECNHTFIFVSFRVLLLQLQIHCMEPICIVHFAPKSLKIISVVGWFECCVSLMDMIRIFRVFMQNKCQVGFRFYENCVYLFVCFALLAEQGMHCKMHHSMHTRPYSIHHSQCVKTFLLFYCVFGFDGVVFGSSHYYSYLLHL